MDVNDLIGKPFASDGYGPDAYSCYGLVWEVYRRYGIDIPQTNISVTACREASNREILEHAARYWRAIEKPEVPCAVLISSTNPEYANHIGVYIGRGRLLHITIHRAVVVDRLADWQRKIIGYYRFIG